MDTSVGHNTEVIDRASTDDSNDIPNEENVNKEVTHAQSENVLQSISLYQRVDETNSPLNKTPGEGHVNVQSTWKEIEEMETELKTTTQRMNDIQSKWEITINDNIAKLKQEMNDFSQVINENKERWGSSMSEQDRQKALKKLHQQERVISEVRDAYNYRADLLKSSMEDFQNRKDDIIREAEERGRMETIQQIQQVKEMISRCEGNERILSKEIDEMIAEKKRLQKKIDLLEKSSNDLDKIKSRTAFFVEEVRKRDNYIRRLEQRLLQSRLTVERLLRFDGRNFDEFRNLISNWQQQDAAFTIESDEIKRQFLKKREQSLIETLIWAQKAVNAIPTDCIYKDDFRQIDMYLVSKTDANRQDIIHGRDRSLIETITEVQSRVSQLPGDCIHKLDFSRLSRTLQNALGGDFSGIQTDMVFQSDYVVNQPQRRVAQQANDNCSLQ